MKKEGKSNYQIPKTQGRRERENAEEQKQSPQRHGVTEEKREAFEKDGAVIQ
jgi:hypothetical protein